MLRPALYFGASCKIIVNIARHLQIFQVVMPIHSSSAYVMTKLFHFLIFKANYPATSLEQCLLFDHLRMSDSVIESFACCLLYTSPSPRDGLLSRMPSSA